MPHFEIHIYGANNSSNFSSSMTRSIEAADLECAAKQAKNDLQTMGKIFPELSWRLNYLKEVQPAK